MWYFPVETVVWWRRGTTHTYDMEIAYSAGWPAGELSNLAEHHFVFEGETCASMEGLLQSLKFEDEAVARSIRSLHGLEAKAAGQVRNSMWQANQILWWQGWRLHRGGLEYQSLLERSFRAMYTQNEEARCALVATKGAALEHALGGNDPESTVLTNGEFCRILNTLRGEFATQYLELFIETEILSEYTSRYRRGGRRAALRRATLVASCLDLVTLVGFGGPSVVELSHNITDYDTSGGVCGYEGTVVIDATAPLYDQAFMYAHECGHVFDMAYMTDELRDEFAATFSARRSDLWTSVPYGVSLQEAFADAYARLSCRGVWWNTSFSHRYWPLKDDERVLTATAQIIETASLRAPRLNVRSGGASAIYEPSDPRGRNEPAY